MSLQGQGKLASLQSGRLHYIPKQMECINTMDRAKTELVFVPKGRHRAPAIVTGTWMQEKSKDDPRLLLPRCSARKNAGSDWDSSAF